MKKIFFTLVIVTLMTINGFAQYKPFQFGLNISPSVNITKSNSDFIKETGSLISYNWGFNGNLYFVENYGISTGFNILNLRGSYMYNNPEIGEISASIKNQYLEVPLTMVMRTEKIGKLRVVGNIGYGLGIRLNSQQIFTDANSNPIEINNQFRLIRHALIIKIGTEFNVYKSSCISAFFVYNNNFTNIYKSKSASKPNISLNSLSLEIDFVF